MEKRPNKLREALNHHQPSLGTRIESTWPYIAEMAASSGMYDYVQFDGEYSPYEQADVENICRASELFGCATVVKVDRKNRAFVAQKAIASGAHGILFADLYNEEEVRKTLYDICPSAPDGGIFGRPNRRFGMNGSGRMKVADYVKQVNDVVKMVMIEKKDAMKNLEKIVQVPGVDMVAFGPHDYAMNVGWEPEEHEEELKQIHHQMIKVALKYGVQPCVLLNDASEMQEYYDLGVRHFNIGDELCTHIAFHSKVGKMAKSILNKK
ncbi:HpcH/HpaI aldolase family protein [Clostridium sp. Marseille-P2415]|uniref:HpcH/HpaI aldolase family protein n=1 Tax=Clostridium sp. Marseille-P2415 TaxID=1805471 RepID=UPI0009882EDA|nr:aldolase/citrate lyase family protein [Clostridium sp. Marseille-P2415]